MKPKRIFNLRGIDVTEKVISLKIVVEGHPLSGKTTFVTILSEIEYVAATQDYWVRERIRQEERTAKRLGLSGDLGRITLDDWTVFYALSIPRSACLGFFTQLENFENGFLGCVVLVDSTNPAMFWWAENIVRYYEHSGYPYIIAANKQDLAEAWSLNDLRIILNVLPHIPIVPCVATDKESVKHVLITLLYKVLEQFEADQATTDMDRQTTPN